MKHLVAAALALALLPACQKMNDRGRVRPFERNDFFPNGMAARLPVAGTMPRGRPLGDEAVRRGTRNGVVVPEIPVPITPELLARGRERFEIYCAPCHNSTGDGQGMIVRRGFSAPPSYHSDRLRNAPAGHFFDVITNGYGAMFSYADRVPVPDRWAIIAYIRALQKSQHVRYDELPAELRKRFDAETAKGGS